MKKDNQGMTLVELIIAILIVMLLMGTAISVLGYTQYGNSKKCAMAIEAGLDGLRMDAMSQAETKTMYLYLYDKAYYMKEWAGENPVLDQSGSKIAGYGVEISFEKDGIRYDISETTPVKIKVLKSTGAFDQVTTNCDTIIIKGGNEQKIHLVLDTGKHYVD